MAKSNKQCQAKHRAKRKEQGLCAWPGCARKPRKYATCPDHRAEMREAGRGRRLDAVTERDRQASRIEDWLAVELTGAKYPSGRVRGGPLYKLAQDSVRHVYPRSFSEAMRLLGWTKHKVKVDGTTNPISVWETAEATGPPMPPVVSFI